MMSFDVRFVLTPEIEQRGSDWSSRAYANFPPATLTISIEASSPISAAVQAARALDHMNMVHLARFFVFAEAVEVEER